MESLTTEQKISTRPTGRWYVALGLAVALLGPVLYIVQFQAGLLVVPWYVPVLGLASLAIVIITVYWRRSIWRLLALGLCLLLTAGESYFLLWASRLPEYAGPVSAGRSMPPFTTTLANGTAFNQESLENTQNSVLVFFRGRW